MNLTFLDIEKLIPLLKASGVTRFKFGELSVSFLPQPSGLGDKPVDNLVPNNAAKADAKPLETEKKDNTVVPQSLEEEIDYTKILHWSSPENEGSVPLTDDAPLNDTPVELPGEKLPAPGAV